MRVAAAQIKIDTRYRGIRYEGQVDQRGLWHGQGVFSMSDGWRYEGEFRDDAYHAHGTMTHPDGSVQSGQWKDNKFLG